MPKFNVQGLKRSNGCYAAEAAFSISDLVTADGVLTDNGKTLVAAGEAATLAACRNREQRRAYRALFATLRTRGFAA